MNTPLTRIRQVKLSHAIAAHVFELFLEGPQRASDIAEETGLHKITAQEFIRALRRRKVIYISAWDPDSRGRDATPVYSLGNKKDTPRRKKTKAQVSADYKERQRLKLLQNMAAKEVPSEDCPQAA